MATHTKGGLRPSRPKHGGSRGAGARGPIGHHAEHIEGCYRPITVHQLTLAWWLHQSGHMTRRQLRVYFALHEMHERRRYAKPGRVPAYRLREALHLVGGRGDEAKAKSEIIGDVKRLRELGLAKITETKILFATSADQIRVDDMTGFWSMLEQMPNTRRSVPVPRRMLRALAAGFSRSVTATVLGVLIRGLYWHRSTKTYRTDGRYKLAWIAEAFGVSRRAVTDARSLLIDLGWLEPLEVGQIMLNRYGLHDRINPAWAHPESRTARLAAREAEDEARAVGGQGAEETGSGLHRGQMTLRPSGGSARQNREFSAGSSSPDLNRPLSLSGNLNTRTPAPMRAGPIWLGGRKKSSKPERPGKAAKPNIRDITPADFASTERLLELHRQAVELGLSSASECGRFEFLALAERARSRGKQAGALFYWLLRENKTEFITQHDEDEASRRWREHTNEAGAIRQEWGRGGCSAATKPARMEEMTDDERYVLACIRSANKAKSVAPHQIAFFARGWSRERWDAALRMLEDKRV